MRITFILTLFSILALQTQAQQYSQSIDKITLGYVSQLPAATQLKFQVLLRQRDSLHILPKLDTCDFDYLLIEERFCFNTMKGEVGEWHFASNPPNFPFRYYGDSLPYALYSNGARVIEIGPAYFLNSTMGMSWYGLKEDYYLLRTIKQRCNLMLPIRELMYDSTLSFYSDGYSPVEEEKTRLEKQREYELENTYQIVTWIDRKNNLIAVSLQFPPLYPEVTYSARSYGIHQW
jgi:hypothetical protein